jgi:hypothetical protein
MRDSNTTELGLALHLEHAEVLLLRATVARVRALLESCERQLPESNGYWPAARVTEDLRRAIDGR